MAYIFSNKKILLPKLYFLSFIVVGVGIFIAINPSLFALFTYYNERIMSLLSNGGLGSEGSRMMSITNALELFKNSPFVGVGLGTTDVHGFIPTMLASLGTIGTILYSLVLLTGFETSKKKNIALLLFMIPFLFFTGSLRTLYGMHMILLFLLVFREHKEVKK
ncbi:hypothetical protein JFV29_19875 [Peribacillus sp. TH16]|uniref:hypothetical protein n=1 Tax=Peribacillus sp. TH16 TaxID=2798482 RepID=UPI001911EBFC|nr:hypothetical protein [Peribacillus sp. TH16]MBK5484104.1 hypothetical protein [Peribacillus sp. TH16]